MIAPRAARPLPRRLMLRALIGAAGGAALGLAPLASAAAVLVDPASAGAPAPAEATVTVLRTAYDPTLQHTINDVAVTVAGQPLTAAFLTYFEATGNIARWGYPSSELLVEAPGTLSQYFQRGAIDFHYRPDLGAYVLERRLVWDALAGDQGVEPPPDPPPATPIGPWGHGVEDALADGTPTGFATFFRQVGGVMSLGYPKTEARPDTDDPAQLHLPGGSPGVIRQYFQAGVMERHPDSPAPVQLALLGDALRDKRYPAASWQEIAAFRPQAPTGAGERLALSGPAVAPAGVPPPRLQLRVLPASVVQGQSFRLDVDGPPGLTLRGVLGEATIGYAPRPGGYWALGGFDPVAPLGAQSLYLTATDASGTTVQQALLTIPVLAGDFITRYGIQNLVLPPDKQGLLDPAVQAAENAFLAPIFSQFAPEQRWRGLFIYPVTDFVLTTGFGERRVTAGQSGFTWHGGLDLAVPEGTPIHAANDGTVVLARPTTVRGNMTILDHGMGVFSGYLHQTRFAVAEGQTVRQGDVIGYVGSTGLSTGPHLHWEMRVHNVHVDPAEWTRQRFGS